MIDLKEYVDKPEMLETSSGEVVVSITEVQSLKSDRRWLVVYNKGKYLLWLYQKTEYFNLRKPKKTTYYRAHYLAGSSVLETYWETSRQNVINKNSSQTVFNWEKKEFEIPAHEVKE